MTRICVMTSRATAYYSMITMLRKAGLEFVSLVPGSDISRCDLILTTDEEADSLGPRALAVDERLGDPPILKGQILSRLDGGKEALLIGVDPGIRIGMAAFYGDQSLEFSTFDSEDRLCARVVTFVRRVPSKGTLVRIGNGNRALAAELASRLAEDIPDMVIEEVNEAGTSSRGTKMRGVQGDQRAAAKIAFRRGIVFSRQPRTRSSRTSISGG